MDERQGFSLLQPASGSDDKHRDDFVSNSEQGQDRLTRQRMRIPFRCGCVVPGRQSARLPGKAKTARVWNRAPAEAAINL